LDIVVFGLERRIRISGANKVVPFKEKKVRFLFKPL
jgi:hypothetical protein